MSTAKVTGDAVADGFLLTVDNYFGGQFSAPLVQLLIGQFTPVRPRAKPVDFLVGVGDETNQVVGGGNKRSHVVVHRADTLSQSTKKASPFAYFLICLSVGASDRLESISAIFTSRAR